MSNSDARPRDGDDRDTGEVSHIPPKFQGTATKADGFGLFVLTLSGTCSCGATDYGLAPDWKVPAENGGGYMTQNCPDCLGTMEYSEQWERVDRFVSDYSELRPRQLCTDGGRPENEKRRCRKCGRAFDTPSYERAISYICESCWLEPAPPRWSAGMAPGTSIKWSYTPRYHIDNHPDSRGRIVADGGRPGDGVKQCT